MVDKQVKFPLIGIISLLLTVGCAASISTLETTDSTQENDRVLVIGDISDEPAETIEGTQPVADYLAARLGDFGISHGQVKIAPNLDTMLQWVANGEVDLYFDSPYPVLVISQQTGAQPILRRWKYGVSHYHSLFFTRKETGITSLEDLPGQMVAFEESFSTSGFMLPLSYLYEQGMIPVAKSDPKTAVAADEVGYVFSTADNTTIQWVVSGKVPVGVVDNITYNLFIPEETREGLVIIAETEAVPRQLVLTSPGMDEDLMAAIKTELISMNESDEGRAALEIFLTTEFDEFPEGADAALERMRTLYRLVQDQ